MIIELCGLPGVGKTTLALQLEKRGHCQIVRVSGKLNIVYYLLKGFLKRPKLYYQGLRWCLRHDMSRYYTWNFFCIRYAKLQKALEMKKKCAILDEGPLSNIMSYSHHVHDAEDLSYFSDYAKLIDRVVCISLTESDRQTQIYKRDAGKTFARVQANDLRERYMQNNMTYTEVVCRQHSKGRVVASSEELEPDFASISSV